MNQSIEQEVIRKLDQISQDISKIQTDIFEMKTDIAVIKANQSNLKEQLSIQKKLIARKAKPYQSCATLKKSPVVLTTICAYALRRYVYGTFRDDLRVCAALIADS